MQEKKFDVLRVKFGMYREHIDDALSVGLRSGDPIEGCPLLHVGPFKIIVSGFPVYDILTFAKACDRLMDHWALAPLIVTSLIQERRIMANSSTLKKRSNQ